MNKTTNTRENFSSRLGFILVSAGCAVGLGNVWKFPYICGSNGGAAFIVIYLFCLLILGVPILICEFSIGRGSGKSIGSALTELEPKGTIWHKYRWPAFAGNYLLMMFYTMVAGWMLYYAYLMMTGTLNGKSATDYQAMFGDMLSSPTIMLFWTVLVIVLCIGVCALGLKNGVERISKVLMVLLIVLMIAMAINSTTLKNSGEGLKFYLMPDFSRMMQQGLGNVIFAAMTHAFFTLSVGIGSMEIFGSYLSKERKITGEALNVVVLDTLIALVAGIIIIPACFAYGIEPDAGPSLLFITLPNVFSHMPAGQIWGIMFFIFMAFAALSTVIAVFENIICMTTDLLGWERKKSLWTNLIGITIASVPAIFGYNLWQNIQPLGIDTTIMDLEDFLVSYNILPLGGLLFTMFCVRKNGWGFDNFVAEADTGVGRAFPKWLRGYMTYVLPLLILVVYFGGYYDMFKDKDTIEFCLWMGLAVIFAGFVVFLSLYQSKKSKK